MTDNKDIWCKGKNEVDTWKYLKFLSDISASEANPGRCSVPCNRKIYHAEEQGLDQQTNGLRGIQLDFSKEVNVRKSSLKLDTMTLLSKIGGYIGLSKNFMWLMILFLSSIGVLVTKFKIHHFK